MRSIMVSSLYILSIALVFPTLWVTGQQKSAPDKPIQEWQRSCPKFVQHVDESRKSDDGGGVTVVTNGSLELALALGNGRITTIKTDAAKRTGLGAEVEFTAVFKGIKESNGSDYVLEFDLPTKTSEGLVAMAFVFSDTNEAARSKWKAAVPGGNVRWQARVDGIAVWFIRPDKPSYLFALKDAKIME